MTHDSFGKSLKAALPDAIGQTIGNMIGDAVTVHPSGTTKGSASGAKVSTADAGGVAPSTLSPEAKKALADLFCPSGANIAPVSADSIPEVTAAPQGDVEVRNLPLVPGAKYYASDWRPATSLNDVGVFQSTFLPTSDVVRITNTSGEYPVDYYTRSGPSGADGTWQTGDIRHDWWTGSYSTLDQWDAENANRPDTLRGVSTWEQVGNWTNGFVRSIANGITGGLANNIEAVTASRSVAQYQHNMRVQHQLDDNFRQNAPIASGLGTTTGVVASLVVVPAKGAGLVGRSNCPQRRTSLSVRPMWHHVSESVQPPRSLGVVSLESQLLPPNCRLLKIPTAHFSVLGASWQGH